jgi:hypothetical protein
MQGSLSIEVDRIKALVRVTGIGFWSPEHAAEHFQQLGETMTAIRQERGHVLVLVDLRRATVQSKETAAVIGEATRRVYAQADRAAVVVATELLNMQIRHVTEAEKIRTFGEIAEAERWLRTHHIGRAA